MDNIFFCNSFNFRNILSHSPRHNDNSHGIECCFFAFMRQGHGRIVTAQGEEMTLSRHGGVQFDTVFRVGVPFTSVYAVGGMRFDAVVKTESLRVLRGTALPAADCRYRLTLGGEARLFSLSFRLEAREVAR